MNRVTLERFEIGDQGVFGKLNFGNASWFTGELPWRENASNISCIPLGIYVCKFTLSNRLKKFTYELLSVEKRTGIRIHAANLMGDVSKGFHAQLNGCIALGEKLGIIEHQKAVLISASAVREFETLMNRSTFTLEIKNA